jgi:multicomponent Na+:H+ antiporter subunit B
MSRSARLTMAGVAGAGLMAVLVIGFTGLPAFGDAHEIVGEVVNLTEPTLRHATDVVTSLNFDIRAWDTLGEEFILFTSVTGVALLLRTMRDEEDTDEEEEQEAQEHEEKPQHGQTTPGIEDHRFAGGSDALRAMSLVLTTLLVAFGLYLVFHGHLTPGGGFQGGVVLAAGPLSILLAGRYVSMKRVAPQRLLEAADALGASGYALIGLGGLLFVGTYLKNPLPLGTAGHLLSSGMMPFNSIAVGLEVSGAFLLVWTEFLDQTLVGPPSER